MFLPRPFSGFRFNHLWVVIGGLWISGSIFLMNSSFIRRTRINGTGLFEYFGNKRLKVFFIPMLRASSHFFLPKLFVYFCSNYTRNLVDYSILAKVHVFLILIYLSN